MRRVLLALLCALLVSGAVASAQPAPATYLVDADTRDERTSVSRSGVDILEVRADGVVVAADEAQARALRRRFRVEPISQPRDFPPADSAYHSFSEMQAEIADVAATHPAVVHPFSIGTSHEGRDLTAIRIGDEASDNTAEPAALFVGLHHAREHLTVEMVLALLHLFTESNDARVAGLRTSRQIYLVPALNPDGAEYDVSQGAYLRWRKNRQPVVGAVGIDLNRNYGYRWGCCRGSSIIASSDTYRGPSPFSAPESAALAVFVNAHSNITTAISYHSYGGQVLYPYGYTYADVPSDMDPTDWRAFVNLAGEVGKSTGYRPEQASDLYITDGDMTDWAYGVHRVIAYTIEMDGGTFYPPDEFIGPEVARNLEAAIRVAELSACPRSAAGDACDGGGVPGLVNGGFEDGLQWWTFAGASIAPSSHAGASAVRLGGADRVAHAVAQAAHVPPNGLLRFWMHANTSDRGDKVIVSYGRRKVGTFAATVPGWRLITVNLSRYAGAPAILKIAATTNRAMPTTFHIDDVVLEPAA